MKRILAIALLLSLLSLLQMAEAEMTDTEMTGTEMTGTALIETALIETDVAEAKMAESNRFVRRICGSGKCSRSRASVRRRCRRSRAARVFCVFRRCRRGRVRCAVRRKRRPTPAPSVSATASPSGTPSSSPTPSASVTPSASPTPSVSATPSISPTPSSSPLPTPATGYTWGDPHVVSFDNRRFDCQGIGEFVLAKSDITPEFEVQGRFRASPGRSFTLSSGIAVKDNSGGVTVQASHRRISSTPSTRIGGCPIVFAINGTISSTSLPLGTTLGAFGMNTALSIAGGVITFDFPSGLRISVDVSRASGCFFGNMVVTVPGQAVASGAVVGLFGTPNGQSNDEFRTRDGDIVSPSSFRGADATDYCIDNWGVRSQSESLFTLESGETFSGPTSPASLTVAGPNIAAAPAAIRAICGDNEECLIDGILVGETFARATLQDERAAEDLADMPLGLPMAPTDAPAAPARNIQLQNRDMGQYFAI